MGNGPRPSQNMVFDKIEEPREPLPSKVMIRVIPFTQNCDSCSDVIKEKFAIGKHTNKGNKYYHMSCDGKDAA